MCTSLAIQISGVLLYTMYRGPVTPLNFEGNTFTGVHTGKKLMKWPGNPINGNPDFVKGNWRGDGKDHLFWYKFKINESGTGELYFADGVFHMFDFMGKGAEEVITLKRNVACLWKQKGSLYK